MNSPITVTVLTNKKPGQYGIVATQFDVECNRTLIKLNDGTVVAMDADESVKKRPRVGAVYLVAADNETYVLHTAEGAGKQGMMGGATVAAISPTNDDTTERMIQKAGKTAPRVVPAAIKNEVVSCHFFTAAQGMMGTATPEQDCDHIPDELKLLTFCVLVLKNGFTVTGESACASPENFDAEIGQKIARENAEDKIWPLLGFRLKDQLARPDTRGMRGD